MKTNNKLFTIFFLLVLCITTNAQQWAGSNTTSNLINRYGQVSIIPTVNYLPFTNITNGEIKLGNSYNSPYIGNNLSLTRSSISISTAAPGGSYSYSHINAGAFDFSYVSTPYSSNFKYFNGDLSTTGNFTIGTASIPKTITINGNIISTGIATLNTLSLSTIAIGDISCPQFFKLAVGGKSYFNDFVGIGTFNTSATTGYKLAVNGGIICEEVKVITDVPASDYVFESNYNLKELKEVEAYIIENKHLPEVPSATEFKQNGYKVGEMDDLLLRKVEELTLYIIAQQKQIELLQNQINQL